MEGKVATPDAIVAEIAGRQHGVLAAGQLRRAGISDDAIRARVLAGRLHRIHRGVYAAGHSALSPEGRCFAAVLAVGGGPSGRGRSVFSYWRAAVSHRSAASLWGLLPMMDGPVDVLSVGLGGKAKRAGVSIHRSLFLLPAQETVRWGTQIRARVRPSSALPRATSGGWPGAVSAKALRRA